MHLDGVLSGVVQLLAMNDRERGAGADFTRVGTQDSNFREEIEERK
jgi:hypothetical protein